MHFKFWSGRRDRLALALVGVIVLAIGLSVMSLLSESIRGTVARTYEQTWRSPYDILVHVPLTGGALLPNITEPNLLTSLPRGITQVQLEAVTNTPGVAVAAPLAVLGILEPQIIMQFVPPFQRQAVEDEYAMRAPGPGLYRYTVRLASSDSTVPESVAWEMTIAVADFKNGGAVPSYTPADASTDPVGFIHFAKVPVLLVGVDPAAEAELAGLNRSLVKGRYLLPDESVSEAEQRLYREDGTAYAEGVPAIPVLLNQYAFRGWSYTVALDELGEDLQVMRRVEERLWEGPELAALLLNAETNVDMIRGQSGPLTYQQVASPFPDRWPVALELVPTEADPYAYLRKGRTQIDLGHSFRPWMEQDQKVQYKVVGLFDSARLSVVRDPISQMPLMTYRPAEALQVLNAAGRPTNPPESVAGGISPVGFLSTPPVMITTIPAALAVAGDGAISAIQVKVVGSEYFTPESMARVKAVAEAIERTTGLVAEVTMGSSPANVLIRVPASAGKPDFGWVEQTWIHKNAATTAVQQTEFGYSLYIGMVIAVTLLYGLATGLAGVTARRRELGVAAAVGWPGRALGRIASAEQVVFALVTGLFAAMVAAVGGAPPRTIGLTLLVGLVAYVPAAIATGLAAGRVSPGEALRWGDTAPGRRVLPGAGTLALALSSLMGRPGRTFLTALATALPTALLLVLAFISRHLNGLLYTSITGQYAAMKAGPLQYIAGLIALAIASVTAFDLVRQNAADHRNERALLHALGWPRFRIGQTMVLEGGVLGLAAGLIGAAMGMALVTLLYGTAVLIIWRLALLIALIPLGLGLLTGLLSSLVELRTWNRAALAGVGERQVARFTTRTWWTAAAALLVVVGVAAGFALPAAVRSVKAADDSLPDLVALAVAEIEAAVTAQSLAIDRLDLPAFLGTLDPAAEAYVMTQRHWLENTAIWREAYPTQPLGRKVLDAHLLGDNTARVLIMQSPNELLNTIWIKASDGRWLEHGREQEVLLGEAVTVWYPSLSHPRRAQTVAAQVEEVLEALQELGWAVRTPLTVELFSDRLELSHAIGLDIARRGDAFYFWSEYGEPLRFSVDRSMSPQTVMRALVYASVRQATNNHAAEWLPEALARYVIARTVEEKFILDDIQAIRPLAQLTENHPLYDDLNELSLSVNTAWMLAEYLTEQEGPDVVHQVLAALKATAPEDPEMTGPANFGLRDERTIAAFEQVTGRSWAQLDQGLQAWFQTRAGR